MTTTPWFDSWEANVEDQVSATSLARDCLNKAKDRLDRGLFGEPATQLTRGYVELGRAYIELAWLESD